MPGVRPAGGYGETVSVWSCQKKVTKEEALQCNPVEKFALLGPEGSEANRCSPPADHEPASSSARLPRLDADDWRNRRRPSDAVWKLVARRSAASNRVAGAMRRGGNNRRGSRLASLAFRHQSHVELAWKSLFFGDFRKTEDFTRHGRDSRHGLATTQQQRKAPQPQPQPAPPSTAPLPTSGRATARHPFDTHARTPRSRHGKAVIGQDLSACHAPAPPRGSAARSRCPSRRKPPARRAKASGTGSSSSTASCSGCKRPANAPAPGPSAMPGPLE